MPLYFYACEGCGKARKKILTPEASKQPQACLECQGVLKRTPRAPTTTVKETLDNGIMVKRVERPADAQALFKERSDKNGPGR